MSGLLLTGLNRAGTSESEHRNRRLVLEGLLHMNTLPGGGPSHSGLKRPGGPGASTEPAPHSMIRFREREWYVRTRDEDLVKECSICMERRADSATCGQLKHRVCSPCLVSWMTATPADEESDDEEELPYDGRKHCPSCRAPILADYERDLKNAAEEKASQAVVLQCAECCVWSGRLAELEAHILACEQHPHPCSWQRQGCLWLGPLEDRTLHEAQCDWRLVPCSHRSCAAQMPRCQRQEHESHCPQRPARLGSLATVEAIRLRMESLQLFCQMRAVEGLERLPEAAVRDQLTEVVALWPLLYQAVQAAGENKVMPCGWRCGFEASARQLEVHYGHCPLAPVNCPHCAQGIARHESVQHRLICDDKPVSCPEGCGARGLRALDISLGLHQRSCSAVVRSGLLCSWCRQQLPADRLRQHELVVCHQRPTHCPWCLASHQASAFERESRICRLARADDATFAGHRLIPHPESIGPVYIRPGARSTVDNLFRSVFIKFPGRLFLEAMTGSGPAMENLTPRLAFAWSGVYCRWEMSYLEEEVCFAVMLHTDHLIRPGYAARVGLYTPDGIRMEWLGSTASAGESRVRRLIFNGRDQSCRLQIRDLSRMAASSASVFFVHLEPLYLA